MINGNMGGTFNVSRRWRERSGYRSVSHRGPGTAHDFIDPRGGRGLVIYRWVGNSPSLLLLYTPL